MKDVDLEEILHEKWTYDLQAEALAALVMTISHMNLELLEGIRWKDQNEKVCAFIEKYEVEHRPALEKAEEALRSMSEFLNDYYEEHIGVLPSHYLLLEIE